MRSATAWRASGVSAARARSWALVTPRVECGDRSAASNAEDRFYRFRREHARDAGRRRAHDAELTFGLFEAVRPLIDVSIDDDPGQRLG